MVIELGEKVHIITRRKFEEDLRRHFLGVVLAVDGSLVRLEGYTFVFNANKNAFIKRPEKRVRIYDLSDSGYIVNIIPKEAELENVSYKMSELRLFVTDGKTFSLDINEFGPHR